MAELSGIIVKTKGSLDVKQMLSNYLIVIHIRLEPTEITHSAEKCRQLKNYS